MKKNKKILKILFVIFFVIIIITGIILIYKTNKTSNEISRNSNKEILGKVIPQYSKVEIINNEKIQNIVDKETEESKQIAKEKEEEKQAQKDKTEEKETTEKVQENNIETKKADVTKIVYGKSVKGRDLVAYLIKGNGNNSKTIFLDFEVHGYEDEYAKDGQVLVNLANSVKEYYTNNPSKLGNYQMIIVPSANPDGVIEGKNNYRSTQAGAFGRCTADGIDMNRDFKAGEFKAVESQKLRDLMNKYKMDIHIDFHGWENSVIGDPTIVKAFRSEVGISKDKSNRYGSGQGYLIEYTKNTYGAHSAIVEFKNSKSVNKTKVCNALNQVMEKL